MSDFSGLDHHLNLNQENPRQKGGVASLVTDTVESTKNVKNGFIIAKPNNRWHKGLARKYFEHRWRGSKRSFQHAFDGQHVSQQSISTVRKEDYIQTTTVNTITESSINLNKPLYIAETEAALHLLKTTGISTDFDGIHLWAVNNVGDIYIFLIALHCPINAEMKTKIWLEIMSTWSSFSESQVK